MRQEFTRKQRLEIWTRAAGKCEGCGAKLCVKFYRWWHNQPGSNTEYGFDEWAATDEGRAALAQSATPVQQAAPSGEGE